MARINSKWPLLLVAGKPVTPEQADDILLRTNSGYWHTNDQQWQDQVGQILGIARDGRYSGFDWRSADEYDKRVAAPALGYLHNARIMSSWIGGPKGWCDWDGTIGCGNWNIGKWPSVPEVERDLTVIAAAWPFLDMRVQLVEDEGAGDLCGEWRVAGGRAMETEPGPRIDQPGLDTLSAVAGLMLSAGRERGVSPQRLASAYQRVLAAHGGSGA